MTSHKEQPAVDTSAEKIARQIEKLEKRAAACRQTHNDFMAQEFEEYAASLRSLAAHPAEPAGMELETTAEERVEWSRMLPTWPDGMPALSKGGTMRLLRDFDRMRARAEKAEAERDAEKTKRLALERRVEDQRHAAGRAAQEIGALRAALATYQQPVGDEEVEEMCDKLDAYPYEQAPVATVMIRQLARERDALSTQLRDAQARGKGMEEALKPIRQRLKAALHRDPDCTDYANLAIAEQCVATALDDIDAALSRPEGSASK